MAVNLLVAIVVLNANKTFTPGVSILVECNTSKEINSLFENCPKMAEF